ncbi:MAG: 4-vinyl reductase [Candidatus Promineifilaceae bacterium]
MLQRVGRASFRWAIKEQQAVMGLAGIALKALPQNLRKKAILLAVRKGLTDTLNYARIKVENDGTDLVFTDYTCPICEGRTSKETTCHIYLGSLGEAMAFATGRDFREFEIIETHCKAKGDAFCRFVIRDRV